MDTSPRTEKNTKKVRRNAHNRRTLPQVNVLSMKKSSLRPAARRSRRMHTDHTAFVAKKAFAVVCGGCPDEQTFSSF
jgi:hypothetical protein